MRINSKVSRLLARAVIIGATPPAHRTVANHPVIVDTVVAHWSIETLNDWLFVTFAIVNVIAVQTTFPTTMCISFDAQSNATV